MIPFCGFTGSRHLAESFKAVVVAAVKHFGAGHYVAVGCAKGADAMVANSGAPVIVFRVRSGSPAWAFAARSAQLVRAVRASGAAPRFVAFITHPCPAGIVPARSWKSGSPSSGSWSTLALAAGLGIPVYVFWCSPRASSLPAWGTWLPVSVPGCAVACFRLERYFQNSLFSS
jgi:hypothetical protein